MRYWKTLSYTLPAKTQRMGGWVNLASLLAVVRDRRFLPRLPSAAAPDNSARDWNIVHVTLASAAVCDQPRGPVRQTPCTPPARPAFITCSVAPGPLTWVNAHPINPRSVCLASIIGTIDFCDEDSVVALLGISLSSPNYHRHH